MFITRQFSFVKLSEYNLQTRRAHVVSVTEKLYLTWQMKFPQEYVFILRPKTYIDLADADNIE